MGDIIEARWDCPSCGKTLIKGRYKNCPACGRGRGPEIKFYVADPDDIVAADVPEKGPDWLCEYCGAYAPYSARYCPNCGAEKSEGAQSYHEVQQAAEQKAEQQAQSMPQERGPQKKSKAPLLLLILAAVAVFLLVRGFSTHNTNMTVDATAWQRQVTIESYNWVDESAWSLPAGAELTSTRRGISGYNTVLDHYETRTRRVPETYVSGYETKYRDLGNGYMESYEEPVYSTRYVEEEYQEPVTHQEPVYGTKYYYRIQRWQVDRTESAQGETDPYWPEFTLKDGTERESGRSELYRMSFVDKDGKRFVETLPYETWSKYHKGDGVNVKVNGFGQFEGFAEE